MTNLKDQLNTKLPDLPAKEQIIDKISQKIQKKELADNQQERHLQDQISKSKLSSFEQISSPTNNLQTNQTLREQAISAHQTRQSAQTIVQLQAKHMQAQQEAQIQAQKKNSQKRKHTSILQKAKNTKDKFNPVKSTAKKLVGKIPVVGGIATAGIGLIGLLEFLS